MYRKMLVLGLATVFVVFLGTEAQNRCYRKSLAFVIDDTNTHIESETRALLTSLASSAPSMDNIVDDFILVMFNDNSNHSAGHQMPFVPSDAPLASFVVKTDDVNQFVNEINSIEAQCCGGHKADGTCCYNTGGDCKERPVEGIIEAAKHSSDYGTIVVALDNPTKDESIIPEAKRILAEKHLQVIFVCKMACAICSGATRDAFERNSYYYREIAEETNGAVNFIWEPFWAEIFGEQALSVQEVVATLAVDNCQSASCNSNECCINQVNNHTCVTQPSTTT